MGALCYPSQLVTAVEDSVRRRARVARWELQHVPDIHPVGDRKTQLNAPPAALSWFLYPSYFYGCVHLGLGWGLPSFLLAHGGFVFPFLMPRSAPPQLVTDSVKRGGCGERRRPDQRRLTDR